MISETALLLKIRKEAAYHRRRLETDFNLGILGGLKIAIFLLEETGREAKNVRAVYKGRLSRWSAAKFRHAIGVGLAYLKRGDRGRGMRILEAAIEHEAREKKILTPDII